MQYKQHMKGILLRHKHILWMALGTCLCLELAKGQAVYSPYTAQEIGEFIENTLPHHAGMGHVGIATPQKHHIQGIQPALLSIGGLTHIHFGVVSDLRQIQGRSDRLRYGDTHLGSALFSLPLKADTWGLRIGLSPYTQMNYRIQLHHPPSQTNTKSSQHNLQGKGGIHRAQIAQGLRLSQRLHIGTEAHYYFGALYKSDYVVIMGEDISAFGTHHEDRYSYRGWGYRLGLYYSYPLSKVRRLSLGAALAPSTQLQRDVSRTISRRRTLDEAEIGTSYSIPLSKDPYKLPTTWQIGIGYQVTDKWNWGMDIQQRIFGSGSSYHNALRVATGLTYVPKFLALQYLKRLPYRIGFSWEQLPYATINKRIHDLSTYLGTSLRLRSGAQIELGTRIGFRGKNTDHTFAERYLQLYMGTVFTNRWFVKEKYN